MSAEAAVDPGVVGGWRFDVATVRTFRYALGSTLAIAVALGIDWQLSYLTPVLTLSFLGSGRPPARKLVAFLVVVVAACAIGVLVSGVLLPYPGVFLLVEGLTLYLLFYHGARGASPLVVTWLMIALTVIPMVALQSMGLAVAVAKGIVVGTVAALIVAWTAHALVPDPSVDGSCGPKPTLRLPPPHLHRGTLIRVLFGALSWSFRSLPCT